MLGPMGKGSRCTLSCKGGFIDCDQRLLLQPPHLKVQPICLAINLLDYEMLGDTCEKAVIILPDFRVQTICLAINLLDYESTLRCWSTLSQHPKTPSPSRQLWCRRRGLPRLTIHGLIYYSTAYYI